MAIYNYEIGGNEIKPDTGESIAAIPENRSLVIEQLTHDEPIHPEAVTGLKTMADVFAHFKPALEVEFETSEGQPINEELSFSSVADFNVKNLTRNSTFLGKVNTEKEFYTGLIKQLRSNKVLQRALEDPQAKSAFISILEGLKTELEASGIKS